MSNQAGEKSVVDTNEMQSQSTQQTKVFRNYHHIYGDASNFGGCTLVDEQDTKDIERLLASAISNVEICRIFSNKLQIKNNDGSIHRLVIVGKLVFVGNKNEKLEDITKRVAFVTRYTLFDGNVWTIYGQYIRIPKCKLTGTQGDFFDLLEFTDDGRICALKQFTRSLNSFSDLNICL